MDYSYFKELADKQFTEAVTSLNHYLEDSSNPDRQKVKQFIEWCLEHYKSDCIELYSISRECFWSENPTIFIGSLASFIANCVFDDSYFVIEYRDYPDEYYDTEDLHKRIEYIAKGKTCIRGVNKVPQYDDETMYNWEPVIIWTSDRNVNATQDPSYLISAIKFVEDQTETQRRLHEELEKRRG